jgi:predicted  nucleic acid-binding Zn-ribbon protein
MTNVGMFEDAETIKYLEEQNKFLKKKLREAINYKAIDTLETDIGIKDWHIKKLKDKIKDLKDEIKDLKDALEKTE